jgi:hypothetical protein
MYIYPSHTVIKWSVKKLNIYSLEEPEIDSKEDIEAFWKDLLIDFDKTLEAKINNIKNIQLQLHDTYIALQSEPMMTKSWEQKIQLMKKIMYR